MSLQAAIIALLPFALLIWLVRIYDRRLNGAYGVPYVWQIISPFNDINWLLYDVLVKYIQILGPNFYFEKKYKFFDDKKSDTVIIHSLETNTVETADASLVSFLLSSKDIIKPVEEYEGLNMFGTNVLTTEGSEWRKHRKVVSPSFSEECNRIVLEATVEKVLQLQWEGEVRVDKDMKKLALHIISAAGFGRRIGWQTEMIAKGHLLSYEETLSIVTTGMIIKIFLPSILYVLPQFKTIYVAYNEFAKYIEEFVLEAKERINRGEAGSDILTQIVSNSTNKEDGLTESEMRGNIFILLLAGHETTAFTLTYALMLLAKYPLIQEKLYGTLKEVLGDNPPAYDDLPRLEYCLWVLYEAMRMYPVVAMMPRMTATDIQYNGLFVEKGTRVNINTVALHRNPKYWRDPDEFIPERFKDNPVEGSFVPFSLGSRACIGRKFALTEGVAVLAMLIQKYRIEADELLSFDSKLLVTLNLVDPVKLRIIKRQ